MSTLGNVLVAAGIGMMIVSLYLAYSLYTSLSNQGPAPVSQTNMTSSSAAAALVNDVSSTVSQESYIILKIVIFFLLASVGYKFARLGLEANRDSVERDRKEDEEIKNKK